MLELRPHFPLVDLLRAAELARSSFYYQLKALGTVDRHCDLKAKSARSSTVTRIGMAIAGSPLNCVSKAWSSTTRRSRS